jgi:tRNA uridine 5-carboxymethylaminomethyl modification enzyme
VSDERWDIFSRKQAQKAKLMDALDHHRNGQWLKRPEAAITELGPWIREVLGEDAVRGLTATVETEIKYCGYISQQKRQMERVKDADRRPIPSGFAFTGIPGLSREIQEKLNRVQPSTLGQAARIPGVTPAAVAILDVYLSLGRVC